MRVRGLRTALVIVSGAALVLGACSSSSKTSGSASGGSAAGTTTTANSHPSLLASNGPCDPAKKHYPLGIITTFASPVLSLGDQVKALEVSVKAFNKRGGIGGHCGDVMSCDEKADPNLEVDCARKLVAAGVVATLNDTTSVNPGPTSEVFAAAGVPRVGISPGIPELSSPVSYMIGAGGVGTTFMMVPACTRNGHKKLAAITVDSPQIGALIAALGPMLKAYGAEIVSKAPVPAGTTDFQQFTLAAEKAGATCAILPLGNNEAVQVLQAAKQLGSKLTFSGSLGTFGRKDMRDLGDFASQVYLNAELPPVTADQQRWPILADVIADLSASGDPALQAETLKSSPVRSWVAMYSLVKIVQDFGKPDDVSKEAITAAMKAAKDVDHFGLIPPWTPDKSITGPGPLSRISQPWYYVTKWDSAKKDFTVLDSQFNVLSELGGKIEYAQPDEKPGAPSSSASTSTTAASGTTAK